MSYIVNIILENNVILSADRATIVVDLRLQGHQWEFIMKYREISQALTYIYLTS